MKKWIAATAAACSFALFAAGQLPQAQGWQLPATLALAFAAALCWLLRTGPETLGWLKKHPLPALLLGAWAGLWAHGVYAAANPLALPAWGWFLYLPALWYTLAWICRSGCRFLREVWGEMNASFRRTYIVAAVVFSIAVTVMFLLIPGWYRQYDHVYSIDSSFCMSALFADAAHYDIRHPALSLMTFPLYTLAHHAALLLPSFQTVQAILLQLINVQMLLLIGVLTGLMARSLWTTLWYYASLPTLLFALSFEKYQLCIFLLVLYAYRLQRRPQNASLHMVLATGAMPTSILLLGNELLIREPFREKLARFALMALIAVGYLACTGCIHLLDLRNAIREMSVMTSIFSSSDFSFAGRLLAWEKMVQGCFVPVASAAGDKYFWTNLTGGVSFLSILILALILIGVAVTWRERFGRICSVWLAGSLALLVVLRWGVFESPLFSIYFSWALISLACAGLEWAARRLCLPSRWLHGAVWLGMLAVNIARIADIARYLQNL